MGERKILNKYIPPDFDPAKIPRKKISNTKQPVIRNMCPMKIRCNFCGHYIDKGTKFNERKEEVIGEKYLDLIKIFRFYLKCSNCSSEIVMLRILIMWWSRVENGVLSLGGREMKRR